MSNHEKKVKANHLEIEMACMKDYEDLTERDLRIQLAASYRLVEELGWSFLIFGHLLEKNLFPRDCKSRSAPFSLLHFQKECDEPYERRSCAYLIRILRKRLLDMRKQLLSSLEMARSLVKPMKVRNANDVAKALIEKEFKKRGL